ncbi:alpha/beta hydrolase [Jatrophihabitans sp.]|uniref:alpha/beta fold hydrolase n=1 Tax=Jatrophihabitans sp. TaxID=1932789 RepID=UPI0030C6BF19|nr:alpha/beta hydrolase fold [Jatrophihabitans sp.]
MILTLGARQLYYERRGIGEPLLLIMGMAGHHNTWGEPFLSALAEHFDVVTFDHRGIGESTDVPGDFSIVDLANDTVALLEALGWESAHVMGISLGGMVAQELVLDVPEMVRTLVIGCSYCGGEGSSLAAPGPTAMLEAMSTGDVEASLRAAYLANLSPAYTADEAHYAPFHDAALSVPAPVQVIVRQAQAAFVHDTSTRLPGVSTPTAVIHGTADDMLLYSNGQQIASLIPTAALHTFDGVGHLFWWERPEETVTIVRELALGLG